MADKLEWMNRHSVLLRDTLWHPVAERENYRIRPDLKPLFEAHPESMELLEAFRQKGLFRDGCEFIARMLHRRAAVWWGYICLLSLLEELQNAEQPPENPHAAELRQQLKKTGVTLPALEGNPTDIDNMAKMPDFDLKELASFPALPPEDPSGIAAASAKMKEKTNALTGLIPAPVRDFYQQKREALRQLTRQRFGTTAEARFQTAKQTAETSPLTYRINRTDTPEMEAFLRLREAIETQRQAVAAQVKAALPQKYPATPEVSLQMMTDRKKRSDAAVQAVYRWVAAPDEVNSRLALECGNQAPGTPEGMLAYTAFWSFGDMAPEGKIIVPTPPELPGTGLNSALLMMAMSPGGTRKAPERYEIYFSLGMEVVLARNLWPDALTEQNAPHEAITGKSNPDSSQNIPKTEYKRWK